MPASPSRMSRLEKIRSKGSALSSVPGQKRTEPKVGIAPQIHSRDTPPRNASLNVVNQQPSEAPSSPADTANNNKPSLDPYIAKLERFELFSTQQCYYLVAGDRLNTQFRILKMDRTLIERPPAQQQPGSEYVPMDTGSPKTQDDLQAALTDNSHAPKPTLRPLSDFVSEDPTVYTQAEIRELLDMVHDGNRMRRADGHHHRRPGHYGAGGANSGGGIKPLVKAYSIVGFVRFLDCYYLTLCTRRAKVGNIGGNSIYTIRNTETIPLKPAERSSAGDVDNDTDPSSVLLSMWNRGKRSVGLGLTNREIAELRYQGLYQVMDLTKGFYFSYTYDLTRSLQENFLLTSAQPFPPPAAKEMYAWNYFLTKEFDACLDPTTRCYWLNPLVHGSFVQRKVSDYGRSLDIILLARRSRHFAGTRYLKRGVSEQGKVANDVEHEQIIMDDSRSTPGTFCSFLQVRGSIPTYWSQESSVTIPKPPIDLNRVDPTYTATQLHFEDLLKRYSSPILVLDLVKQSEKREREVRVGDEYRHAVDYINATIDDAHKIRYCALDYSHVSKHRHLDVSASLNEASTWAVNQTGFFCSAPKWKIEAGGAITPFTEEDCENSTKLAEHLGIHVFPMEQNGVLRTNCIDCLDRTNVAQFSAGVEAMSQQLVVMGIRSWTRLGPSSNIVRVLIDMYVEIGDSIALQYGGSEAHKKVTADSSESNITGPIGKHKELLTSIRRYYSNAFTDRLKQDAINLFLGYYLPFRHTIPLWEMESDYYLHNFHVKAGRGLTCSMKSYRRAYGISWNDEDECDDAESAVSPPNSPSKKSAEASRRVQRVRHRCEAQKESLSHWWKLALQHNLQQRIWMQLRRGQPEVHLAPRFDRVYEPEKLAQFDRFFSRAWATPVRRSHAAQHTEGAEDGDGGNHARVISSVAPRAADSGKTEQGLDTPVKLGSFIESYGYEPRSDTSLRRFTEYHSRLTRTGIESGYIGDLGTMHSKPREEYVKYVSSGFNSPEKPQRYRPERIKEFEDCLGDYTLTSDNVDGIRKLALSSHLGETIHDGPYEGLPKHGSAIEVATAIQEQFNALESIATSAGGQRLVERELQRQGLFAAGVKASVADGLRRFATAEKQYEEVLDTTKTACRRSDLTTTDSLRLYSFDFDRNAELSTADQIFLLARQPDGVVPRRISTKPAGEGSSSELLDKAASLGIKITPRAELDSEKASLLYPSDRRHVAPKGFEQINDDLFSRRENKFMVFNGAGVNSWTGAKPVTKLSHSDNIVLSSLF